MLGHGYLCRATRPYYEDQTPVWPDETYPHRIGIDVLDDASPVRATSSASRTWRRCGCRRTPTRCHFRRLGRSR